MKREMDFGSFVGGHYVEKREEKDMEDAWFDGVMDNVDSQVCGEGGWGGEGERERERERSSRERERERERVV